MTDQTTMNGAAPPQFPQHVQLHHAACARYAEACLAHFRRNQANGVPAVDAGAVYIDLGVTTTCLRVLIQMLTGGNPAFEQMLYEAMAQQMLVEAEAMRARGEKPQIIVPTGRA